MVKRFVRQSSLLMVFAASAACSVLYAEPPNDLDRAVHHGDVAEVRRLIVRGSAGHVSEALQWAARGRHPAGPHRCKGESAAHVEIVGVLIDAGADVNARDGRPDGFGRASGWTPLHVATHHGQWAIARQLLVRGADPNRTSDQGITPSNMPGWAKGTGQ